MQQPAPQHTQATASASPTTPTLPAAVNYGESSPQQQMQHIQAECQRLRHQAKVAWQQVADLKQFLNDYGLVWVGEDMPQPAQQAGQAATTTSSNNNIHPALTSVPIHSPASKSAPASPSKVTGTNSNSTSISSPSTAQATVPKPAVLPFSLSELQRCLDELNQLAGDGVGKVAAVGVTSGIKGGPGRKAGIKMPDAIKLTVFQDGIQLHNRPPRGYGDATADAVLRDVFDGYFPSVLRREFPDGVVIQLNDRSANTMAAAAPAPESSSSSSPSSNMRSFQDLDSMDAYVSKVG